MRNQKRTVLHEPDKGVYLFVHGPSRLEFCVKGNRPEAYLVDCIAFPDRKDFDEIHHPNSLTVLDDFKVTTRYQFTELAFYPTCPGQMNQMLALINACPCLEAPEIVVSLGFFNHVYGIKD